MDLSTAARSVLNGVRDGPFLHFMIHERVFFVPAAPRPVMHQDHDVARVGNTKLSL